MNPFLPASGTYAVPRSRKPFVAGLTAVLVVAAGGAGYAAWSATATGSSESRSLTAVTATVTVSTGSADLYPGVSGDVHFTITNPNDYPVVFTSADLGTVVSDDETACPAGNVTVHDKTGLLLPVAAGATTAPLFLADAVTLSSTALDGCQGRTFVVTTTLTGTSS